MDNNTQGKKPQLEDVAIALGLSKSTVSRAISGKGRISEKTRERVRRCIKEMNYSPNMIAKSFSESRTYNIGVVIPLDKMEAEAPFFQTCLMGITKLCALRNYDTLVIGAEKNDLSQLSRVLKNSKTDGVIITRPMRSDSMEKLIAKEGIPFVSVGKSSAVNVCTVDSAHQQGCCELTSYLLLNNRKLSLILGNMDQNVNKSRLAGFTDAFDAAGLPVPVHAVYTGITQGLKLRNTVAEIIGKDYGCIICGDDMICMEVMNILASMKINVPEDIRVASFYDSLYLDMYSPPVTALRYNAVELGMSAASSLIDMIEGNETQKEKILGFEMLIRRSTM